ncbi:MAG: ribbon-helix-helix domain-containing protein [Sterolibacterium sp.]
MRTLVDIPEKQIQDLALISKARKLSRSEIIRQAISAYISSHKPGTTQAFGLWGKRKIDGLAYQDQVRTEW